MYMCIYIYIYIYMYTSKGLRSGVYGTERMLRRCV